MWKQLGRSTNGNIKVDFVDIVKIESLMHQLVKISKSYGTKRGNTRSGRKQWFYQLYGYGIADIEAIIELIITGQRYILDFFYLFNI